MIDITTITEPIIGKRYVDLDAQRELEVTEVNLGDALGREILGLLSGHPRNGHAPRQFSTDLATFSALWRAA